MKGLYPVIAAISEQLNLSTVLRFITEARTSVDVFVLFGRLFIASRRVLVDFFNDKA
jgi:hypothetical protein